jgi:hypothetical protein
MQWYMFQPWHIFEDKSVTSQYKTDLLSFLHAMDQKLTEIVLKYILFDRA